jgi:hypothetical protein
MCRSLLQHRFPDRFRALDVSRCMPLPLLFRVHPRIADLWFDYAEGLRRPALTGPTTKPRL